jgi:hypothetical protein
VESDGGVVPNPTLSLKLFIFSVREIIVSGRKVGPCNAVHIQGEFNAQTGEVAM